MTEPCEDLDPAVLAQVARELATEVYTLEQVLRRYKFTPEYFEQHVYSNPFYQHVYKDYVRAWRSLESTNKRIAFHAAAALEEKLPGLAARMGDSRSDLADAIAAAKLFRELAGIAAPVGGAPAGSGEKFAISINFGEHKVAIEARPETTSEEALLQTIPSEEGPTSREMVPQHAEGSGAVRALPSTTKSKPS